MMELIEVVFFDPHSQLPDIQFLDSPFRALYAAHQRSNGFKGNRTGINSNIQRVLC